ncbi:MAG: beta-ketoacyl synthase N-terminal-like domain-containing protein [Planctomycetota bacterium]
MDPTESVITGVGVVSSIGIGREAYWESVRDGRSGICDLSSLDPQVLRDIWVGPSLAGSAAVGTEPSLLLGGPILDFEGKQFVKPRKALKVMSREIQTSFAASQLALTDAGIGVPLPSDSTSRSSLTLRPDRFGTVFGSEMLYGQPDELADAFAKCCDDDGRVNQSQFGNAAMQQITPLWMLKYLPNMPACHVGIAIGAHGPNNTLTLGDVSGPSALIESLGYLRRGVADVIVAAGCGSRMNQTRSIFTEDQPLSSGHEPIERSSRPHATDAGGLVRGEAAAAVIVETQAAAETGDRRVRAVVAGAASRFVASKSFRSGNRSKSVMPGFGRANASAMILAMESAMKRARVSPSDVGLVVSHGMGDRLIDDAELTAINQVLPGIAVTLPISLTGHTGAASGMLELVTGILSLEADEIPPVPHSNSCVDGINVSDEIRPLGSKCVLVLTHTSPGSATAIVLTGQR